MARSRVELFEQIRRDWRAGGSRSGSWPSGIMCTGARCGRRWPVRCRRRGRRTRRGRRAIGPYTQVIDAWLVADRDVPRKQRHTARRIWQRLVAEHGASVAEVTVSRYVARRRAGLGLEQVQVIGAAVPREPGAEAEVDFGEFHAVVAGVAGQAVDVRDAAVVLGPGVPRRVRHPGAGGVPGRARAGVGVFRRAARPGPLRQPQARRDPGAARPGPGRIRAVHRAAQPFRVRLILLRPGPRRRA